MPHLPHALSLWKQPTEDVSKAHQAQSSDNRRTAGQNKHAPKYPHPFPMSDVEFSMSDLVFSMSVIEIPMSDIRIHLPNT